MTFDDRQMILKASLAGVGTAVVFCAVAILMDWPQYIVQRLAESIGVAMGGMIGGMIAFAQWKEKQPVASDECRSARDDGPTIKPPQQKKAKKIKKPKPERVGYLTLTGQSGFKYKFAVFPIESSWRCREVIYVVSNRYNKADGSVKHWKIYVGQTDDMPTLFLNHDKFSCFQSHGATHVSILREDMETDREGIVMDILHNGSSWPCNE